MWIRAAQTRRQKLCACHLYKYDSCINQPTTTTIPMCMDDDAASAWSLQIPAQLNNISCIYAWFLVCVRIGRLMCWWIFCVCKCVTRLFGRENTVFKEKINKSTRCLGHQLSCKKTTYYLRYFNSAVEHLKMQPDAQLVLPRNTGGIIMLVSKPHNHFTRKTITAFTQIPFAFAPNTKADQKSLHHIPTHTQSVLRNLHFREIQQYEIAGYFVLLRVETVWLICNPVCAFVA